MRGNLPTELARRCELPLGKLNEPIVALDHHHCRFAAERKITRTVQSNRSVGHCFRA